MNKLKYSCVVIDDEQFSIDNLKKFIELVPCLNLIECYRDPLQALIELPNTDHVDLILLDIDMPNINGIELSRQIRSNTAKLVFTTGYIQYGYDAFEVNADAYLLKPYSVAKFASTITRLFPEANNNRTFQQDYFFVKSKNDNHKLSKVYYKDVVAVESKLNYVMIYTTGKNLLTYISLTEIAETLTRIPGFVKYHRSFIINKDHIDSISGNTIKMCNGLGVTVGDNYRPAFIDYLENKLLKAGRKI